MKIDFYKHNISDTDINNCIKVLNSLFLTTAKQNKILETILSKRFNSNAVTTSSWTGGAHITLTVFNINEKDEVVTTPLSFVATSNVIEYVKAHPIFVDVDPLTGNIDLDRIIKKISKKTKMVFPVHLYGQMINIKKLKKLLPKHIIVIEDAAHAFESEMEGNKPGDLSDAAIFSFYATKVITSGEGGAVITKNLRLANKIRKARNHGLSMSAYDRYSGSYKHYDMEILGYKYNLTDIQAGLLKNQIEKVNSRWEKRKILWEYYDYKFNKVKNIDKPKVYSNQKHAYYLYTIWVPPEKRDNILTQLLYKKIGVAVNFRPIHLMKYYRQKYGYSKGDFPNAEMIGSRTITLPFYNKIKKTEIDFVVNTVDKLING